MDKPLHFPWDQKTFHKGVNRDIEPDLGARMEGHYYDDSNMRPVSVDGNTGSLEKIGGETLRFSSPSIPDAAQYVLIGSISVNGNLVEFWCHPDPSTHNPIIRINGIIMGQSPLMPWLVQFPLQIEKAENCQGGVIMVCDDNSIPMLFNIQAIIDANTGGLNTYTTGFVPAAYQINAPAPPHRPRFYGLEDVGGGGGLFPGQYWYALRYVNDSGDRTNIGFEVGPIEVPISRGPYDGNTSTPVNDALGFPGASLAGASQADFANRTRYGAKLKFRIDNRNNYSRIELIRTEINTGAGLTSVPVRKVCRQIPLTPGQIDDSGLIIDKGEQIELIPADEGAVQRLFITKAKSPRYIEGRMALGNIGVASSFVAEFREVGGERAFPITKNIGVFGHADAVNHCYWRSNIRGERYSYGIVPFDGSMGSGFVTPMVDDMRMPDRRDRKAADSITWSDSPIWAGMKPSDPLFGASPVDQSFEAFDHDMALTKGSSGEFVNIWIDGSRPLATVNAVPPAVPPFPFGVYNDGGNIKTSQAMPLHPTRYDDAVKFGLNYNVNTAVINDVNIGSAMPYSPRIFQPNFHALGIGAYGVTNALGSGITAFAVVRKPSARRVVAQGIAAYTLSGDGVNAATKAQWQLSCYFPDMEAGIVPQGDIDHLLTNPTAFSLEFQSPLGICSELYGSANSTATTAGGCAFGAMCDQLTYARIQWDTGQINPATGVAGLQPTSPGPPGQNYVGFKQWRNPPSTLSIFDGGNHSIPIDSIFQYNDDTGVRSFNITLTEQIYQTTTPAGEFTSAQNRLFHEPFYVVNLVLEGNLTDPNADYEATGHYQMISSTIGMTDGTENQVLTFIDESRDDAVALQQSDLRYTYLTYPDGSVRAWVCITNTTLNPAVIQADIGLFGFWTSPDGTLVYGMYNAGLNADNETTLIYGAYGTASVPPSGSLIEVRYNPLATLRAYGGDSTICPALYPHVDKIARASAASFAGVPQPVDGQYVFPSNLCPLPYSAYSYNPRYYVPYQATLDHVFTAVRTMRQWVILFDCEARTPLHLNHFGLAPEQSFPNIQYVLRPYFYDESQSLSANGVFEGYELFYPGEKALWARGGIRYKRNTSLDYAAPRGIQFFDKPPFFQERTDLCNAIAYSEKVNPLDQDSPGFKTYPASNLYFIEDNTGEIKKLWSANTPANGYNLYAFTTTGFVLLPVNKSVAFSANGEEFALTRSDIFLSKDIWLSKGIGMPDERWMVSAEGQAPIGNGDYGDTIFWADKKGVYRSSGGKPIEIARGRYLSKMLPFLQGGTTGMASLWNQEHNEYWLQIDHGNGIQSGLFVYSADENLNNWIGEFSHRFDGYLFHNSQMYGFRELRSYVLNSGFVDAGGDPMECSVTSVIAGEEGNEQEFCWYGIHSENRPSRVEFRDRNGLLMCQLTEAQLRKTDGYMSAIPRTLTSYSPRKDRVQAEYIFVKAIHEKPELHRIRSSRVQIKEIV